MAHEEIRRQERSQQIIAAQVSAQRRLLEGKVIDLNAANEKLRSAQLRFASMRERLMAGKMSPAIVPLLHQELSIRETEATKAIGVKRVLTTAVDVERGKLERLEALYSHVGAEISRLDKCIEWAAFEELLEERTAHTAAVADNTNGVTGQTRSVEPTRNLPTSGHAGLSLAQYSDSRGERNQHQFPQRSVARPTVNDLRSRLTESSTRIDSVDVWRQLERCGVNLDLKLSTGVTVSVALTRTGPDTVSVGVSPSAVPPGRSSANLRAEIVAALTRENLKVSEFRILEAKGETA